MKLAAFAVAALAFSTPAFAGNLDTFEAPAEVAEEAPMGGSNAAWIIPLIAIVAIAVASSGGNGEASSTDDVVTRR